VSRSRPRIFAIEPDAVQVTWRRPYPGAALLTGLEPDTEHEVDFGGHRLRFRTPAPPPGAELFRLATVSDMHFGEVSLGYFDRIREDVGVEEPYPLRCARAALAEATAWGAEHVIVKGDATHRGEPDQYETLGKVLAEVGLPAEVLPGNHEKKPYRTVEYVDAVARLGLAPVDPFRTVDLPGLRVVLIDTAGSHHHGSITHAVDRIGGLVDGRPALVVLHHHLQRFPLAHFWPPGIPSPEGNRFLDALSEASPAAIVASGHTHRHRTRRHRNVVVTETGSPKDYPGTWTGYVVHEGGIRQVVRRVARPDCIAWTEYTRRAAAWVWGFWSPGTVGDRCFVLPF
jgi:hypothetical protein